MEQISNSEIPDESRETFTQPDVLTSPSSTSLFPVRGGKIARRSAFAADDGAVRMPWNQTKEFRIARYLSLSWTSTILATLFLILTALYASQSRFLANLHIISSSPSATILILRVLSELAGVLLAAAIASAFEKLQFILVARSEPSGGLCFTDYLALEAGTGVAGLVGILLGPGITRLASKGWTLLRLCTVILVPLFNVLIMSKLFFFSNELVIVLGDCINLVPQYLMKTDFQRSCRYAVDLYTR
jgi:hypothetical protein